MKSSKLFIIAVLAVIAISVTVVSVFSEAEAQEVTSPLSENTISVTGTATTKTEPNLLHIQFGVEIQEKTAKEALEANSQLMNSIVEAIKKIGIEDSEISTSSLNIYPIYDQYEDPLTKKYTQDLIGYRVSNILSVETKKLDLAASIIDNAVGAGVNRVDNVYFTLSPDTHLKIKDGLLADAISNAKSKAEKALLPLD
ncbi:MAG: SIMPL domain-containing protein, partial [Nitrosopumilaceae archaeon]